MNPEKLLREYRLHISEKLMEIFDNVILEDHVERNSFCSNMSVASMLNKESKADSAMWGCLILWSYQKDGSITASFSFSRSLASG